MTQHSFSEPHGPHAAAGEQASALLLAQSELAAANEIYGEESEKTAITPPGFEWRSEFATRSKPAKSRFGKLSPRTGWALLLGMPVLFAVLASAIASGLERVAHANVLQRLGEARAAGMPLSITDIPMTVAPANQNAAPIYREAQRLLEGPLNKAAAAVANGYASTAKPADRAAAVAALPGLQPLFDLLGQLPSRPLCDFQRDWNEGANLLFPEYAFMKGSVKYVILKADVEDQHGDWKAALADLRTADRIGTDAASDPILIGLLVRNACRLMIDREYEQIIGRHLRDAAVLSALSNQIGRQIWVPNLRRVIGGEIAMSLTEMHTVSPTDLACGGDDPRYCAPSPREELACSQTPFVRDSIDASFLEHSTQQWREMPTDATDWQAVRESMVHKDTAIEADHSAANFFAQEFSPTFLQAMDSVGLVQTHDRLLMTSVTLLRARLQTGRLPEFLPSSLKALRIDPFDGNLLRYRPKGSGFKLYSIGGNRVDDGGRRRSSTDPGSEESFDEVVEFG